MGIWKEKVLTMKHNILIVEDEKSIRDELTLSLENAGYTVTCIENFVNILEQISMFNPDLILLDIGIPESNGYSICMEIRKGSKVPIIFVTSKDTLADELRALSLGGDDYISKPYDLSRLLARIQAVLRRNSKANSEVLTVNGLTCSIAKGEATYGGHKIDITKNEAKILWCLMQKAGNIVSRMDLIEYLWENQVYIDDNTLSVNINRLRNKLEDIGLLDYITTKRGLGYYI